MSDLIDRQALLRQIDIDSDGEPGYYGDTWKFIDTIKRMPSALDTNLAQVGTDLISRQALLDKFEPWLMVKDYNDGELNMLKAILYEIRLMPPATGKNVGTKDGTNMAEVGTDCISRKAAIDICDNAIDLFRGQFGAGVLVAIKESIEELPPAQPDIIRCKDCKHRDPEDKKCDCGHDIWWQLPRQDDWYCADAERRTEWMT